MLLRLLFGALFEKAAERWGTEVVTRAITLGFGAVALVVLLSLGVVFGNLREVALVVGTGLVVGLLIARERLGIGPLVAWAAALVLFLGLMAAVLLGSGL